MNINFNNDNTVKTPELALYFRDKKTLVDLITPIKGLKFSPKINALSELSFDIPKYVFDPIKGQTVETSCYNKIKKSMVIKSTYLDNMYLAPNAWDENENVTGKEFLSINWWIIDEITEAEDDGVWLSIKCCSYESVLRERKTVLYAGNDDNKQVMTLKKCYRLRYRLPDDITLTGTWAYYSTEEELADLPNYTFSTINSAPYIILDSNTANKELVYYFTNKVELCSFCTEKLFPSNRNNRWKDYTTPYNTQDLKSFEMSERFMTGYQIFENYVKHLAFQIPQEAGSNMYQNDISHYSEKFNLGEGYYIFIEEIAGENLSTLSDNIESTQDIWKIKYISPILFSKARTFEDTSIDIYTLCTDIIPSKMECLCVFDCDNHYINFYTYEDYFGNKSPCYFGYNEFIKSHNTSTSEKNILSCINVNTRDDTDYSIGYVNPLGNNKIYDFSGFYHQMPLSLVNTTNKWKSKIQSFENACEILAKKRLTYVQSMIAYETKMIEAITNFNSVLDEINSYITQDFNKYNTYSIEFNAETELPLIPIAVNTDTSSEEYKSNVDAGNFLRKQYARTYSTKDDEVVNDNIRFMNDQLNEFIWQISLTDNVEKNYPAYFPTDLNTSAKITKYRTRLQRYSNAYYKARAHYATIHNKLVLTNALVELIYYCCKPNNYNVDITYFKDKKVGLFTQNKSKIQQYNIFNPLIFEQDGATLSDLCLSMNRGIYYTNEDGEVNDNGIHPLFNPKAYNWTITPSYPNGFVADLSNTFVEDSYELTQQFTHNFTQEQYLLLQYYIVEGNYTDENNVFSTLSSDSDDLGKRELAAQQIATELNDLYIKAKNETKFLVEPTYEMNFELLNFLTNYNLAVQYNKDAISCYNPHIYLGATIHVELLPNNWQEPYILEMEIDFDEIENLSLTCSNNYNLKPLEYRFADLYPSLTKSGGLSLDYVADSWFE